MITIGLTRKEVEDGICNGSIFYGNDNIQFANEVDEISNEKKLEDVVGNVVQVYFDADKLEKFTLLGFEMCLVRELDFSKCKGFSEYLGKK